MSRPLVWLTVSFCLGIFIAGFVKIIFPLVYFLAVIFLILSLSSIKKGLRFDILVFCLIFLLGAVLLKNYKLLPKCHISKYISYKNNRPYKIKGIIVSEPTLKINKTSFVFKTKEMQFDNLKHNCCGNILVYIKGEGVFHYAEELVLSGNLYRPFSFNSSNRQSYRNYLYNQGIWAIMNVRTASQVVRLNEHKGLSLRGFALWLKAKMEKLIFQHVSRVPASVLDAMVLGEKRNIPPLIYNSMVKSGTVHILVVSGFNVGIVTFIIILFLRLIRIPQRIRFYIATPLLIVYCLMTGASTPVVRATVMAIVFMFAYGIKREVDIYNSLSLACLFILMVNPAQLFDIGLQLSFASVVSIVYIYPKIKSLLPAHFLKIKIIKLLIEGCLVSFSAWLGTMGFVACYFKIFSPITVVANLFIVPLATLITLCGFSLIIMGLILPALTPFFVSASELLVKLMLNINTLLIKFPGAYLYWS